MLVGSRVALSLQHYCQDSVSSPWQFGDLSLPCPDLLVGISDLSHGVRQVGPEVEIFTGIKVMTG
ncbi:MAG: hypothetical protein CMM05_04420 [Rhodopirellula sp.]|nr:hypothetical protein [Rhodopirellula sp.]